MAARLKVGERGVVILPKALREKAGIREGVEILATVVDDGILLSPKKEKDVVGRLLGLAKSPRTTRGDSVTRIRSIRQSLA